MQRLLGGIGRRPVQFLQRDRGGMPYPGVRVDQGGDEGWDQPPILGTAEGLGGGEAEDGSTSAVTRYPTGDRSRISPRAWTAASRTSWSGSLSNATIGSTARLSRSRAKASPAALRTAQSSSVRTASNASTAVASPALPRAEAATARTYLLGSLRAPINPATTSESRTPLNASTAATRMFGSGSLTAARSGLIARASPIRPSESMTSRRFGLCGSSSSTMSDSTAAVPKSAALTNSPCAT